MIVGVDIGGTFTDFAMLDPASGSLKIGKRLTTPEDPSVALLAGVDELCGRANLDYAKLDRVSHATTLVTNAIIERKGGKTGLLVTKGFRDILLMGRESRYDHYDFRFDRPEPLVPRSATAEIDERISWNSTVLQPIDSESIRTAVRTLRDKGIRSLAVCLLHAYRNPAHERDVQKLIAAEFPDMDCTISSDVAPEIREYERASTTAANAYVRPLVRDYLSRLQGGLGARGLRKRMHVMLSNGGLSSVEVAQQFPIQLIESGPAAGALAASIYANNLGLDKVLAFDMGGTTAKMCCIENGSPSRANVFEAARVRRFKKGSGLPLMIPVIELIEIGAGGGSLARVDELGFLRVGPDSAGARPGPAAYGLGGDRPTVTDADLVLGYIDPGRFLGGDMKLDRVAAEIAVANHVAVPLDRSVVSAAWNIFSVVNEAMVAAGRRYVAERGLDVRDFSMVVFGGAAPIHAWQVARILGIRKLVFPIGAGAMSAVGLCVAAPVVNLSRTRLAALDARLEWQEISRMFLEMEAVAVAMLVSAGAQIQEISITRSVDIRYSGQGYEVEVPITGIGLEVDDGSQLTQVRECFRTTYAQAFGRAMDSDALEAVTWRIKAAAPAKPLDLNPLGREENGVDALTGYRQVNFGAADNVSCPIYDRYRLRPGESGTGPALFEERETTVVVDAGARWEVDKFRNLLVSLQ